MLALITPLLRAFIRYVPTRAGKKSLWTSVIEPHFAWNSHSFIAKTVFGSRIAGNTQDLIQQYIYYFGIWEPPLTGLIQKALKPGDTFIDVGANIGYFSLLASKMVGEKGHVVALEASPRNYISLKKNLEINSARNVRALNVAISGKRGVLPVYNSADRDRGKSTLLDARDHQLEEHVEALALAEVLDTQEVTGARFIKVDVEGAEVEVVQGMLPILRNTRPDLEIMISIHYDELLDQGLDPGAILNPMVESGFIPYVVENYYSPSYYLQRPKAVRPPRLRGSILSETDLIFSRRDEDYL